MCIAIVCDTKRPTLEQLKNSEERNKDGGGIAWVENGKVRWKKNIKAEEIYQISQSKDLPQLIHFRIASVGGVNPFLCHPFPIMLEAEPLLEGEADAVLIHNGGFSKWNDILMQLMIVNKIVPKGPISDTRVMAMLAAHVGNTEVLQYLGEKAAVLKADKRVEVYKVDSWTIVDGIYFSNNSFEKYNDIGVSTYPYAGYIDRLYGGHIDY